MKVLIVDDSTEFLKIAEARLAKEGCTVVSAVSGAEGLASAEKERPDLILLDLDMPDMSGFDVCKVLKDTPELCMIPVMFLSGSVSSEDKVKGLDLGAVDYITKPFDSFELRARVRAALRTKHMQDLLIKYSQVDPLTDLWNRRALFEKLKNEWHRLQRHGGHLSLVMGDIDNFKEINDTYGHPVGDDVLCDVARLIRKECRDLDFAARYGGDEFAILCPHADNEGAAELAERCRHGIEEINRKTGKGQLHISASFGVADNTGLSEPAEMVDAADKALYESKQNGRNCITIQEPPQKDEKATPGDDAGP